MTHISVARIAEPNEEHAADLYVDGIKHALSFRDLLFLAQDSMVRVSEMLNAMEHVNAAKAAD